MFANYWREVIRQPVSLLGICLGLIIGGIFLFGSLLIEYKPMETSLNIFFPPDSAHLLGTNDVGQDIASRLLAGGRNSLKTAVGVGFLSTFLAVFFGAGAALAGGRTDRFIMRTVDVLLVIPNIVIIIIISAYIRPTLKLEIIIISLLTWLEGARVIRAQVLSIKERAHVYAAVLFGANKPYIFFKHLLPELIPLISTLILQGARRAVFMEAGLAFIGVVDPNAVSWGSMISHALKYYYLDVWQWWLLPVGATLSLTLLSFTMISYGVEEALLPRLGGKNIDPGNP